MTTTRTHKPDDKLFFRPVDPGDGTPPIMEVWSKGDTERSEYPIVRRQRNGRWVINVDNRQRKLDPHWLCYGPRGVDAPDAYYRGEMI